MKIELISEWELSAEDDSKIADLLSKAFDTDFGGRSFYQQRQHVRIVARDGDVVIGHMALSFRVVRQGDKLIDVAGLAEVATDPGRRGQGIATRLLRHTIDFVKGTKAEFFVLFGDAPLYAANGFRSYPMTMRAVDMVGVRTTGIEDIRKQSFMVMPMKDKTWDPEIDLDLLGWAF